jgi:hypothetical protein
VYDSGDEMKQWKLKTELEGPIDEETGIPKWTYQEYIMILDNGATLSKWVVD